MSIDNAKKELEIELVGAYADKNVDLLIDYIKAYQQVVDELSEELDNLKRISYSSYLEANKMKGEEGMRIEDQKKLKLHKEDSENEPKTVLPVLTISSSDAPAVSVLVEEGSLKAQCPKHGVTSRLFCVNRAVFCAQCLEETLSSILKPLPLI